MSSKELGGRKYFILAQADRKIKSACVKMYLRHKNSFPPNGNGF